MKKIVLVFLCVSILLSLSSCGNDISKEGDPLLSRFNGISLQDDMVDESILKSNSVTMINLWGTFCSPCIEEMPDIEELYEAYSGQGFGVLGIVVDTMDSSGSSIQKNVAEAKSIVKKLNVTYKNIIPNKTFFVGALAQNQAVPVTYFVDRNGCQLGEVYTGKKSKSEWEELIKKFLENAK